MYKKTKPRSVMELLNKNLSEKGGGGNTWMLKKHSL